MIFFARYGLSILLMLLQLAVPLIHAHKNESNFDGVFHLPEFEQISVLLEKSSMVLAPVSHEGEIVTVGTGMKNNKRRFLSDNSLNIFVISSFFITFTLKCLKAQFFVKSEPIDLHFFNLAAPRAPPKLLFL